MALCYGERRATASVADRELEELSLQGAYSTQFQQNRLYASIEHLEAIAKEKRLAIQPSVRSMGGRYVPGPESINGRLDIENLERRIASLKSQTEGVKIAPPAFPGIVGIGSSVVVIDDLDQEKTFNIVGIGPSDVRKYNEVKYFTPVGQSLLGKQVGDEAEYVVQGQKKYLEILSIGIYNPDE